MEKSKVIKNNGLTERMVRNESIFCSLLFDQRNRTLRVIDFRGGNFQSKQIIRGGDDRAWITKEPGRDRC